MPKLVECVPNFSEGRRPEVIKKIVDKIRSVPGVYLFGQEMDVDHNRTVITIVGAPEPVLEAAFQSIQAAAEMIDLNYHKGEHPRMGAADVCPFIPLQDVTMEECVELSRRLGKRVGEQLQIPVFLYESAATKPERKNLADVRKGEFEKLREWIGTDPSKKPDYGPEAIHPTAGAIAIGARFFLVAYNVNLKSTDLALAKKIARSIREKDGGFPCVKALGFDLKDRQMVQISMNLTDYRVTSMKTVFDEIRKQATGAGVEVAESEVIGLIPYDALESTVKETLLLKEFKREQVIEEQIADLHQSPWTSPEPFLAATASPDPTPGGGSVSALAGALAAALGHMVYGITAKSKKYGHLVQGCESIPTRLNELQRHLFHLVREDSETYENYLKARKLPQETDEQKQDRRVALENASMKSILVPMDTMKTALDTLTYLQELAPKANPAAISDIGVGALMAIAAIEGAYLNVRTNFSLIQDEPVKAEIKTQAAAMIQKARQTKDALLAQVETILG